MEGQITARASENQNFISNPYFGTFEEAAASSLRIGTDLRLPQILEHSTTETSKSAALSPTTSNLGTVTLYTPCIRPPAPTIWFQIFIYPCTCQIVPKALFEPVGLLSGGLCLKIAVQCLPVAYMLIHKQQTNMHELYAHRNTSHISR